MAAQDPERPSARHLPEPCRLVLAACHERAPSGEKALEKTTPSCSRSLAMVRPVVYLPDAGLLVDRGGEIAPVRANGDVKDGRRGAAGGSAAAAHR